MSGRVYLDWNASAPLRPEARAAMLAAMDAVGNPSSVHAEGRAVRATVERARAQVAALVGCEPSGVVFTSGATEAANLVACLDRALFMTATEHDAVQESFRARGAVEIGVARDGRVDVHHLGQTLAGAARPLLAVQGANGETGIEQPIAEVARTARAAGSDLLTDVTQSIGRTGRDRDDGEPGPAFACLSAHKIGGPKGVGALVVREGAEVAPFLRGGGQEMGRRSGTENVLGIAGFGAAAEAALRDLEDGVWERTAALRDNLEARLEDAAPDTIFVGRGVARLPNTSCFASPGWKGETQVMQLDLAGFAVSAGSACSSGKVRRSRVLTAMGYEDEIAGSAIRVSFGPVTTEAELAALADTWSGFHRRRRERAA